MRSEVIGFKSFKKPKYGLKEETAQKKNRFAFKSHGTGRRQDQSRIRLAFNKIGSRRQDRLFLIQEYSGRLTSLFRFTQITKQPNIDSARVIAQK